MKKLVNGKVVDITNIDLFKKAFEGIVLDKKASSEVKDTIENSSELVKNCVKAYSGFSDSLPFPLFSIETDMKYVAIALYILDKVDGLNKEDVAIDNCIYIRIESNKILKLMYHTWAIEAEKNQFDNSRGIDLEAYKEDLGYKEFIWSLERMREGVKLDTFYAEYMASFLKACNNEDFILRWELNHILDFGKVPEEIQIEENRLISLAKNYNYFLDVYSKEERKTKDSIMQITIKNGRSQVSNVNKLVKVYDFDVYGKSIDSGVLDRKTENKIEKRQVDGMASLFETILIFGIDTNTVESVKYRGIIDNDSIIFEIDHNIYECKFSLYSSATLIANNVSIYSFGYPKLYMKKSKRLKSGIYEDTIFAYDLTEKKARLCKIKYRQ